MIGISNEYRCTEAMAHRQSDGKMHAFCPPPFARGAVRQAPFDKLEPAIGRRKLRIKHLPHGRTYGSPAGNEADNLPANSVFSLAQGSGIGLLYINYMGATGQGCFGLVDRSDANE
jgi:hypothetical protein